MRLWLAFAAFNGMVGVILGAIGSHALKASLTPERLAWLDTGMRYQMWHALALAAVAVLMATGLAIVSAWWPARQAAKTAPRI